METLTGWWNGRRTVENAADFKSDIPDSFIAADDIETGFGNKIPLWLFGFLY